MHNFTIATAAGQLPLGRFASLAALAGVGHGVSTRKGPDFASPVDGSAHARAALALAKSAGLAKAAWMRQAHGGKVIVARGSGLLGEADALVTSEPGLAILGRSADCPLILAVALAPDGTPRGVGIAHASWKGTVARVAENMVAELLRVANARAENVIAAIAPSAGPCCYEVGDEVRDAAIAGIGRHAADFFEERSGELRFDLWRANLDQLLRSGLRESRLSAAGLCTICENRYFHSWRRDGAAAGRFAAAIGLRGTR